jgi:NAD(P)-dependent dehydrogenase (short-subunit alcohol dehydrogenase family)
LDVIEYTPSRDQYAYTFGGVASVMEVKRSCAPSGREERSRQHRLAGEHVLPGRRLAEHRDRNPALFEVAVGLNPTGHMGTPKDVAASVVFLASPAASRVSGTNLVVDGALTRRVQL